MKRLSSRTKWTGLVLVAGMSVGAAMPAAAAEKTTLAVWDWWAQSDPNIKAFFQWMKTTFEAEHPGVTVEYKTYGFGEYVDKIVTSTAVGEGPDVIGMSVLFARDLWNKGLLSDLTARAKTDKAFEPENFLPSTQLYNQRDGHIYGEPWYVDTASLVYDMRAFRDAGLDTDPKALQDWDQFIKASQKLTKKDGTKLVRAGYAMPGFPPSGFVGLQTYAAWLASDGADFYDRSLATPAFNNDQGRETLQLLHDLIHNYGVSNFNYTGIVNGQAAMVDWHTGAASYLRSQNPSLEFGMTSFPHGPSSDERGTITWGNMLGVIKSSQHQDLAWDWVAFASSLRTNVAMLTTMERPTAPRFAFYHTPEWNSAVQRSSWLSAVPDIVTAGGYHPYPFRGGTTLTDDVAKLLSDAVDKGSISPGEALTKAEQVLAPALQGN